MADIVGADHYHGRFWSQTILLAVLETSVHVFRTVTGKSQIRRSDMTEMPLPTVAAAVFPAVSDGITHQHQFRTALGRLLKFFLAAGHPPTQRPVGGQGPGCERQLLGRQTAKRIFMSGR